MHQSSSWPSAGYGACDKYEEVYLHTYQDLVEAREHLRRYFVYNDERPHQAHGGLPPSAAYYSSLTDQLAVAKAA